MDKKSWLALIAFAAIGFAVSGCGSGGTTTPVTNPQPIIAFGDSITVGTGTDNPSTQGFVYQLAGRLASPSVTNHAVGGTEIGDNAQITTILATPVDSSQIVIFLTGYNDELRNGEDPVHLAAYLADLKQILDYWEASGTNAYVGIPLVINADILEYCEIAGAPTTAHTSTVYANAVVSLIKNGNYSHIHIVDTHWGWYPERAVITGIHPNNLGATQLAAVFFNAITGGAL